MDKNLTALKPALVWKHFAEIVRIPRPSSHEEQIRRYVLDVARSLGLECREDAGGADQSALFVQHQRFAFFGLE